MDWWWGDKGDGVQRARRAVGALDVGLKRILGAAAVLGAVGGAALWLVRRRHRRLTDSAHPLARALLDAAERRLRRPVPAAQTVRAAVLEALAGEDAAAPAARALFDALRLYEAERFGGRRHDGAAVRRARKRLRVAASLARDARAQAP